MDIVIEGRITPDEGLADIIQTVLDLKNIANPILRLTSAQGDLQGRIGFGHGFILGGRVSSPEETGYPAIRKLLTIQDGTYAILDPGRTHVADVNQTLWIKANRVVSLLPNLPESPQQLLDGADLQTIAPQVDKALLDPMDLKVAKRGDGDVVNKSKSQTRGFDLAGWRNMRVFLFLLVMLLIAAGTVYFWDKIVALIPAH